MRNKIFTRAAIALGLCLLGSCLATDPETHSKNAASVDAEVDAAIHDWKIAAAGLMEEPMLNKPDMLTGGGSMAGAKTKATLTPYQQHEEINIKMKVGASYIKEHKAKKEKAAKEKTNKEKAKKKEKTNKAKSRKHEKDKKDSKEKAKKENLRKSAKAKAEKAEKMKEDKKAAEKKHKKAAKEKAEKETSAKKAKEASSKARAKADKEKSSKAKAKKEKSSKAKEKAYKKKALQEKEVKGGIGVLGRLAKDLTPEAPVTAMISSKGKISLWVGFAGMFLPFLWFSWEMTKKEEGMKKFHVYTTMVNAIAAVAYLVMASGYGWEIVDERQFFYVRYVDWFFTTPLLLLDLCALGKASEDTTSLVVGLDLLMIVSGVIGASLTGDIHEDYYKPWTFYALGVLFFLPIVYQLGVAIPSKLEGENAKFIFSIVSTLTVVTWTIYPVVWVLAEGTHIVTPDVEVIMYTVLDLLSKSLFGVILISSHAAMEEAMGPEDTQPLISEAKEVEAPVTIASHEPTPEPTRTKKGLLNCCR